MRDHLFHAENDEMLFRQFREESQITYNIPPVHNSKSFIKFYFPKPYSLNIQVCHFFSSIHFIRKVLIHSICLLVIWRNRVFI